MCAHIICMCTHIICMCAHIVRKHAYIHGFDFVWQYTCHVTAHHIMSYGCAQLHLRLLCVCARAHVCVCVFLCGYMCVYVCVLAFMCVCVLACACEWVCAWVCVCLWVGGWVDVCSRERACSQICIPPQGGQQPCHHVLIASDNPEPLHASAAVSEQRD